MSIMTTGSRMRRHGSVPMHALRAPTNLRLNAVKPAASTPDSTPMMAAGTAQARVGSLQRAQRVTDPRMGWGVVLGAAWLSMVQRGVEEMLLAGSVRAPRVTHR
jgi:hypothetical protein